MTVIITVFIAGIRRMHVCLLCIRLRHLNGCLHGRYWTDTCVLFCIPFTRLNGCILHCIVSLESWMVIRRIVYAWFCIRFTLSKWLFKWGVLDGYVYARYVCVLTAKRLYTWRGIRRIRVCMLCFRLTRLNDGLHWRYKTVRH